MKYFESNGVWFPADKPSIAVGGILRYSADGLRLTLIGKFREGWTPRSDRYPVIHGVIEQSPYGKFVTMYDCFTTRLNLGWGGVAAETIRSSKALIGGEHFPAEPTQFRSMNFTVSYLSDWWGKSGLKIDWPTQKNESHFALRYHRPDSERCSIGDKVLTLAYLFTTSHSGHDASISEKAHVFVEEIHDQTPEQTLVNYVSPIQNLLTFATDTPNEVEDIQFHGIPDQDRAGPRKRCNWICDPIFRLENKKDRLTPNQMLFTLADSRDAGLDVFQSWLNFAAKYERFCTVYFALQYAPPTFLEEEFLRLMSAFRLFDSSFAGASERANLFLSDVNAALTSRFSSEDPRFLAYVAPSAYEVEMPFHLLAFLRENESLMRKIINIDFSDFVTAICNTMAFAERTVSRADSPFFQEEDLYFAIVKIQILIKILVLRELGFDQGRIATLIERNNEFVYLKSV